MADLGWTPIKVEPAGPPWGWNPGQVFVTNFMAAQENKRLQEKAAQEAELAQILLPYQKSKAALELDKLQQEVERGTLINEKLRQANKTTHQNLINGLNNPDSGSAASIYNSWGDAPTAEDEDTGGDSGGMGLNGDGASAAPVRDFSSLASASSAPEPASIASSGRADNYFTDEQSSLLANLAGELPETAKVAEAGSGLTKADADALAASTAALAPNAYRAARDSGNPLVDFAGSLEPNQPPSVNVPLFKKDESAAPPREKVSPLSYIDAGLSKRAYAKSNHTAFMEKRLDSKNPNRLLLDNEKLRREEAWKKDTAESLKRLSPYGVSDLTTLEKLTDLPSDIRRKALERGQKIMESGKTPEWTTLIREVGGFNGDKGFAPDEKTDDKVAKLVSQRKELGATYGENPTASQKLVLDTLDKQIADGSGVKTPTTQDKLALLSREEQMIQNAKKNNFPGLELGDTTLTKDQYDAALAERAVKKATYLSDPDFLSSLPTLEDINPRDYKSPKDYQEAVRKATSASGGYYKTSDGRIVAPGGTRPLQLTTSAPQKTLNPNNPFASDIERDTATNSEKAVAQKRALLESKRRDLEMLKLPQTTPFSSIRLSTADKYAAFEKLSAEIAALEDELNGGK